jgi:hypothetical protein
VPDVPDFTTSEPADALPERQDPRPLTDWSEDEIRAAYGNVRISQIVELEKTLTEDERRRLHEVLLPAFGKISQHVAELIQPKISLSAIIGDHPGILAGAFPTKLASSAFVGTKLPAFASLQASLAQIAGSSVALQAAQRTAIQSIAASGAANQLGLSRQISEAIRPLLSTNAAALGIVTANREMFAKIAEQVTGQVSFARVFAENHKTLLAAFDAVALDDGLAAALSSTQVSRARDMLEQLDPVLLEDDDGELGEVETPSEGELVGLIAQLMQGAGEALQNRNLVVATVYVVVLMKCLEVSLLASPATMGIALAMFPVTGHQIAKRSATLAGDLYDRVNAPSSSEE